MGDFESMCDSIDGEDGPTAAADQEDGTNKTKVDKITHIVG